MKYAQFYHAGYDSDIKIPQSRLPKPKKKLTKPKNSKTSKIHREIDSTNVPGVVFHEESEFDNESGQNRPPKVEKCTFSKNLQ